MLQHYGYLLACLLVRLLIPGRYIGQIFRKQGNLLSRHGIPAKLPDSRVEAPSMNDTVSDYCPASSASDPAHRTVSPETYYVDHLSIHRLWGWKEIT